MPTAKKAVAKATKKVAKKAVEKGSAEWLAKKAEARKALDAKLKG